MRFIYSLNGEWHLALDPDDVGIHRRWHSGENLPETLSVRVPSVWDLWAPDYDGVGWYIREFDAPEDRHGRLWELRFEAADYYAEVWLNGIRLGEHEGGYTPFSLPATHALRDGRNLIAVRIIDPHGPAGYAAFLPRQIPCSKEHGYFTFAGLWGSVDLIGKPHAHITDVFVQPDIYRKRLCVAVSASADLDVHLSVAGTSSEAAGKPGKFVLKLPDFECWSPETPVLYTIECTASQNGAPVDQMDVRFGMRDFTVKNNRFYLNNRPIFVKGVLHQPDYPLTLAAPASETMARKELELAKEAGFNLIRLHIKTAPEITLRLCDEIGLMAYEEPPIGWIQASPYMRERCEREVREMILRDRNHPCVVIWGILNESGNAGYVVNGGAQTIKDDLCRLARRLDPTRLIIDDSGGMNTTREPSRFMRPYRDAFERYDDLHIYQRAPVDAEIEQYYRHSGEPNTVCFLSEFGFGGIEDLADVVEQFGAYKDTAKDARFFREKLEAMQQGFEERELDRLFGDFAGFTAACRELQCDAARHQIDACRGNRKLAGYCYTQLCDAGHEVGAGILDHWRRPKPAFKAMQSAQARSRLFIQTNRTNLSPRQETKVSVLFISEDRLDGQVELSLQVVGPTSQVLWKKRRMVQAPKSGRDVWSGAISASGSPGLHTFHICLTKGRKVIAGDSKEFYVYPDVEPCDTEIHVVDPHHEWQDRCARLARLGAREAPVHVIPPPPNTVRAYPAEHLADVLARVQEGAAALVFEPPDDWNDLADAVDPDLRATSKDAVGAFLGMYHYVKAHPVFEGLPDRCLMRQPYRNVVPARTFLEKSDEDICGTFDTNPMAPGHYMLEEAPWWGSDILVRRYGSGRIVFTHLRVLEHLGENPVADRLFVNLIKHFARRSVPSKEPVTPSPQALEWLRKEQAEGVRRWMVIGMFPNWNDAGHDTAFPPEERLDFDATYQGWYKPIRWRRWYSTARDGRRIDLQQAFTPVFEYYPRFDRGVGYAYTEFTSLERQPAALHVGVQDATKVWLNGRLVFEDRKHRPHQQLEPFQTPIYIRQGRNTVLVKVSKVPGEFQFSLDVSSATQSPLSLTWWR